MNTNSDMDLRYPIGRWTRSEFSEQAKAAAMTDILFLPRKLEYSILNLDEAQLATPYREGGWTLRQVVHHVADSHMNAYCRFKLGLTEDRPVIKPYDEAKWAALPDVDIVPVNMSLTMLHALHARWHELMKHLGAADWDRTVVHPENNRVYSLWDLLTLYAWHGNHHVAHVSSLRERMGW
jgi:uncharacterized damage-inducible protein DinB